MDLFNLIPLPKEDIKMLALSFVVWTAIYNVVMCIPIPFKNKYCVLTKKKEVDVQNRTVSAIHGLILMFTCGYEFYFTPGQCGDTNT